MANQGSGRSLLWPAVLVGIGVAGSLDEILLHQLLRWHHFYDRGSEAAGLIADGVFHLGSTAVLAVGLVLLVRRWRAGNAPVRWAVAGILLGAGGFNLYDGIVQHKLLGLHQVRAGAADNLPYDVAFVGVAAVMLLAGLLLLRVPGRLTASAAPVGALTWEAGDQPMGRRLEGAVVVITGASSGIGRATALAFAQRGSRVVLAARRAGALEELARDCQAAGGPALAVPTDVTDEAAMAELARRAVEGFGRIDVWVNNAGVYQLGSLESTPPEAFRRVLETNFFGYVHGARAVLPRFREQGHGVLVNNASVYAHVGAPWLTAYVSSKFAVRGFSEALRQELRDLPDVHVCTVSPSPIDSPIFASAANYTGRALTAPPPTYPPEQVARAIVASALRPRRERIVGGAGRQLTLLEAMAPRLFERVNRRYVDALQFTAEPAPATDGNLYAPSPNSRAQTRGGWRCRPDPPIAVRRLVAAGLLAAGSLAIARIVTRSGRS